MFGVAQLIGIGSEVDRASIGLLFGFQQRVRGFGSGQVRIIGLHNSQPRPEYSQLFAHTHWRLLRRPALTPNNCSNSNTRQKKEPKWKGSSTLFSCFRINWGSCYFRSVNPLPRTFDLILLWWDTVNHYCLAITFIYIAIITNSVKKKNKKK